MTAQARFGGHALVATRRFGYRRNRLPHRPKFVFAAQVAEESQAAGWCAKPVNANFATSATSPSSKWCPRILNMAPKPWPLVRSLARYG
jgi:hypothetical protein